MFGRISFIFLILSLCPLTLSAVEMKISSDATIQNLATGEKHKYTAQDNFIYNDKQPLWVESTGKIPFLLVPLKSESGVINIDSPNVSQVLKEEKDLKIPNMRGIMMARQKALNVVEPVSNNTSTVSVSFEKPAPKSACKLVDASNIDELIHLLHTEAKVI